MLYRILNCLLHFLLFFVMLTRLQYTKNCLNNFPFKFIRVEIWDMLITGYAVTTSRQIGNTNCHTISLLRLMSSFCIAFIRLYIMSCSPIIFYPYAVHKLTMVDRTVSVPSIYPIFNIFIEWIRYIP